MKEAAFIISKTGVDWHGGATSPETTPNFTKKTDSTKTTWTIYARRDLFEKYLGVSYKEGSWRTPKLHTFFVKVIYWASSSALNIAKEVPRGLMRRLVIKFRSERVLIYCMDRSWSPSLWAEYYRRTGKLSRCETCSDEWYFKVVHRAAVEIRQQSHYPASLRLQQTNPGSWTMYLYWQYHATRWRWKYRNIRNYSV